MHIHLSVFFQVQMFALNADQMHVVNHVEGKPSEGKRNILQESARIARGDVTDLAKLDVSAFDALIIPGDTVYANMFFSLLLLLLFLLIIIIIIIFYYVKYYMNVTVFSFQGDLVWPKT